MLEKWPKRWISIHNWFNQARVSWFLIKGSSPDLYLEAVISILSNIKLCVRSLPFGLRTNQWLGQLMLLNHFFILSFVWKTCHVYILYSYVVISSCYDNVYTIYFLFFFLYKKYSRLKSHCKNLSDIIVTEWICDYPKCIFFLCSITHYKYHKNNMLLFFSGPSPAWSTLQIYGRRVMRPNQGRI